MDYPLTLTHLLERSAKLFPKKEIASKLPDGMHRHTYADFHARVHAVARGLERLGVKPGDRVLFLVEDDIVRLQPLAATSARALAGSLRRYGGLLAPRSACSQVNACRRRRPIARPAVAPSSPSRRSAGS